MSRKQKKAEQEAKEDKKVEQEQGKEQEQEVLRSYAIGIGRNLLHFLRWGIISVIVGLVVGAISTLFAYCLRQATDFRTAHTYLILFLPLAGLVVVFLYRVMKYQDDRGTNEVLASIHAEGEVPPQMAPLIFLSTIITHLFGGSAGREGAALQLGGSLGQQLGRLMRLDDRDRRTVVMCGMSAAFSAIFGTPIAASIFSLEVASVGIMHYSALVPCVFSALVASAFAVHMGIEPDAFHIVDVPSLQIIPGLKIIGLAICCAALSALFCMALHFMGAFLKKHFKNPYLRVVVTSFVIILLTIILNTSDYMGAGVPVIERAMEGEVHTFAFFWKIVFTALTLAAGFKGGEIVPSFFIGATFGCLFGHLVGFSPSLCAAVGMMGVFCGVTNCPVTSMLISFELFGYAGVPYFMLGISVSYLMSGYYGLYKDQKIVYSKSKTEYIDQKTS